MHGPDILARFLSQPGPPDRYGQRWQYHSRSDRHSKVGCWGVAFDLLSRSSLMQAHAQQGKIVLGLNHEMRDFQSNRKKDLDLVIARPESSAPTSGPTFQDLVDRWSIPLEPDELRALNRLPDVYIHPVSAVLVAVEAKACMTAHVKSLPRLYDELNSSHLAIHGASTQALAIGYVQVNASDRFISPIINSERISEGLEARISFHRQPEDTQRVLDKVAELPRRTAKSGQGFDAIGVSVLDIRNDGSPVSLVAGPPAPATGSNFYYPGMIARMANEYDATFSHI